MDQYSQDTNEKINYQNEQETPTILQQTQADLGEDEDNSNNKQPKFVPFFEQYGKFSDTYTISKSLGQGVFADVRECVHKISKRISAVKIIKTGMLPPSQQSTLLQEAETLKKLDHPNILRIQGVFQEKDKIYIVTEKCEGGELFELISSSQNRTEQQSATIMKQLLSAVAYCHSHQIVHRDIKPEDILLLTKNDQDLHIKLSDFGSSTILEPQQKLKKRIGTPYYIAPEVLNQSYDEKCDVWSCGVILYILICGYPPFSGQTDTEIMENIKKGEYEIDQETWQPFSKEALDLLKKMLVTDTNKRYSAQQALEHPWIQKYSQTTENLPLIKETLNNMKNFNNNQSLSNAIYAVIVNQFATAQEKIDLLSVFKQLDLNSDGLLSLEELMVGLKKVMGEEDAQKELELIMGSVGKDSITYSQFIVAAINKNKVLSQESLEKIFQIIDRDNSGVITIEKLKSMFGNGISLDQKWQKKFEELDFNNQGEISFQEFEQIMMQKDQ